MEIRRGPAETGRERFARSKEALHEETLDLHFDSLADGLTREG